MKKPFIIFCFALCGVLPVYAMTVSEDFTTHAHKDSIGTDADWNTEDCVLRLPSTQSMLLVNESSSEMVPVNAEAGWRFAVTTPGCIIGLGRYFPEAVSGDQTLHLWSDAGTCLATALVSGTTGWSWAEIDPVELSTSSFYRVSAIVSSCCVFGISIPFENDYIKLTSACVSAAASGFPDISTGVLAGVPDILFRTDYQTYAEGRSTGYDSGTGRARYLSYSSTENLNSGTINYEFSFSSTSIIWYGWLTDISDYVSHKYVRWRAVLTSSDSTKTPELVSIAIHSNSFPEPPEAVFPADMFYINYSSSNLSWNEAFDPDSEEHLYRLQVDNNSVFSSPEKDISGIDSLFLPVSGLAQDRWFWRVKAKDDYGDESYWSETYSFFVDLSLPEKIANLNGVTGDANGEIKLSWTSPGDPPFNNISSYEIFYASFSFSESDISSVDSVPGPTPPASAGNLEVFTMAGLLNDSEYFFAVQSCDAAGNVSPLSNVAQEITNAHPSVSIVFPSTGSMLTGNNDIIWQLNDPNPGDTLHDIRILLSKDGGLNYELLHELSDVSVDRWNWDTVLSGNGGYFKLKIVVSDSRNLTGTSLETGNFSIDNADNPPTVMITQPLAGTVNTGLTLIEWDFEDIDPYDAVYFNLYISSSAEAGPRQLVAENLYFADGLRTGSTSYMLNTLSFPDGGDYEMIVEASDGVLVSSSVSGRFSIWNVNHPPGAFSLLSPADAGTVSKLTPSFLWQGNGDPDVFNGDLISYHFFLYSSTSPETLVYEITSISTNSCTINDTSILADFATYFWKVRAEDLNSETRMSSEMFSFYVTWSQIICGPVSVQSSDLPANSYVAVEEVTDSTCAAADDNAFASPVMKLPGGSNYKIELRNSLTGNLTDASGCDFNLAFSYEGLDVISPSTLKLFTLADNDNWALVPSQQIDAENTRVTAQVSGLSYFRLLSYAAPAAAAGDVKNYPNPFNPLKEDTEIECVLTEDSVLEFEIYSPYGDLVISFTAQGQGSPTGVTNIVTWDGRNGKGAVVANGVYILNLTAHLSSGGELSRRRLIGVLK
ncbi:MAG: DUF4082 domain-containing protein [Elusimicrobiota bacterium]|nr:DUF4082 domain-containing protein [Elusimicrobiota bacterium]